MQSYHQQGCSQVRSLRRQADCLRASLLVLARWIWGSHGRTPKRAACRVYSTGTNYDRSSFSFVLTWLLEPLIVTCLVSQYVLSFLYRRLASWGYVVKFSLIFRPHRVSASLRAAFAGVIFVAVVSLSPFFYVRRWFFARVRFIWLGYSFPHLRACVFLSVTLLRSGVVPLQPLVVLVHAKVRWFLLTPWLSQLATL